MHLTKKIRAFSEFSQLWTVSTFEITQRALKLQGQIVVQGSIPSSTWGRFGLLNGF